MVVAGKLWLGVLVVIVRGRLASVRPAARPNQGTVTATLVTPKGATVTARS